MNWFSQKVKISRGLFVLLVAVLVLTTIQDLARLTGWLLG